MESRVLSGDLLGNTRRGIVQDYKSLLVKAKKSAESAFEGQRDHAGILMIGHFQRVAAAVARYGLRYEIVAYLHDIVEDCHGSGYTLDWVGREFDSTIMCDVESLTRREGEVYMDYIRRILDKGSVVSRLIKIADLQDHLRPHARDWMSASYQRRCKRALEVLTESGGRRITQPPRATET